MFCQTVSTSFIDLLGQLFYHIFCRQKCIFTLWVMCQRFKILCWTLQDSPTSQTNERGSLIPSLQIMVEFAEFSLHYVNECYMNQIMIYDKYAWEVKRMKTFCSTSAPSIMTTSNRAYIRFQAHSRSVKNYWKIVYTAYRDCKKCL